MASCRVQPTGQQELALAREGVQRYLWQSAYGVMLIEVRDGVFDILRAGMRASAKSALCA